MTEGDDGAAESRAAEEGEGDGGGHSSSGRLIATDGDLRLKRTSELLSVNGAPLEHITAPRSTSQINKM